MAMPTAVVSCCIEFNLGLAAASLLSSESYVWVWSSTILTLTFPRELCPWLVFQGKYYSIQARLLLLFYWYSFHVRIRPRIIIMIPPCMRPDTFIFSRNAAHSLYFACWCWEMPTFWQSRMGAAHAGSNMNSFSRTNTWPRSCLAGKWYVLHLTRSRRNRHAPQWSRLRRLLLDLRVKWNGFIAQPPFCSPLSFFPENSGL